MIVTSALLESDTGNIDGLKELQDRYQRDLTIEVWGAEALGRKLRGYPHVVLAIFGSAWAKAWCGFESTPMPRGASTTFSAGGGKRLGRVIGELADTDGLGMEVHQAVAVEATGRPISALPPYLKRDGLDDRLRAEVAAARSRSRMIIVVGDARSARGT